MRRATRVGSPAACVRRVDRAAAARYFMVASSDGRRTVEGLPQARGLYDPRAERDSCGTGFVVDVQGEDAVPRARGMQAVVASAPRALPRRAPEDTSTP